MKKMLFIYNPKAGKAQIRNKLADILDVFTKGDYEITVYPTQKSEDAMEKTRDRSKDYDIVVCSGSAIWVYSEKSAFQILFLCRYHRFLCSVGLYRKNIILDTQITKNEYPESKFFSIDPK